MGLTPAPIEASNLFRFYHNGDDETFALRGVSISVQRGETVAVKGPSGSGKSTLLHCLAGLDEPDGGTVRILGEQMTRRPEAQRAALRARHIGTLLQSGNLFDHLDVTQNVGLASAIGGGRSSMNTMALLESVQIDARRAARPTTLSGGELARAGLATALANNPPVLLADEPTGEVDAETERAILELFKARARNGGANLIVTHSSGVAAIADRTLTIVDGSIIDG